MTGRHAPTSSFRPLKDASQVPPGRHILGIVNFATRCARPTIDQGYPSVAVHLAGSVAEGFAEVWTSDRPVQVGEYGSLSYAGDGDFLFGACRIPERADYALATESAYREALDLGRSLGYRQIFRIWHYISQIGRRNADGIEVYQQFCVGRARVLEQYGMTGDMPAATVIGSHGGGIVFYFLACRDAIQVNIDNPRQVPPRHYPSRYGPRSPNFARATYLAPGRGEQIYVSGTAGILGHQTTHHGDVELQCRLALENIAYVVGARNLSVYGIEAGSSLTDLRSVKVYVRRRADIARVQRICREALSVSAGIVFLHADVCRPDLLVEAEGIVVREHRPAGQGRAPRRDDHAGRGGEWAALPAAQQPDWRAHPAYRYVRDTLSAAPPLVTRGEIADLRGQLGAVAAGGARLLQIGDCAESFYESTPEHTRQKITALDRLAERLGDKAGQAVVKVGRLGGQYAKPRSEPFELVGGVMLPAFRGHMINAESPSADARRHDPLRMLWAYHFSAEIHQALRAHRGRVARAAHPGPWSSHDALVMDYMGPLLRVDEPTGDRFLGTTHFPWVGERTSGLGEAHVKLLSLVSNPVAGKVGPRSTPESVLRLCALLDPGREPGRLALIVRMGWDVIGTRLSPIARAVRHAGYPVVWLCDPMHGNTVRLPSGNKVRYLDHLVAEATGFRDVLEGLGLHAGGLHLETAADDVTECVSGGPAAGDREHAGPYTSLCDPRLNFEQAAELIDRVF